MDPLAPAESDATPLPPGSKPSKIQGPRSSAQLAAGVRQLPSGGVFKSAAVEVLRRERRLMPSGEICRLALEWGLLRCSGKTPEATMASCLYSDVKRGGGEGGGGGVVGAGAAPSVFVRPAEGMFGLREWVEQGILPPEALNAAPMPGPAAQGRARQRKRSAAAAAAGEPPAPAASHQRAKKGGQTQGAGEFDLFYRFRATGEEGAASAPAVAAPSPAAAAAAPPLLAPQPPAAPGPHVFPNQPPADAPSAGGCAAATPALPPPAWQPRRRLTSDASGPGVTGPETATAPADGAAAVQVALEGVEAKVAAVEQRWGPLHPQSGRAHLLLYSAYSQHCSGEPQSAQQALAALMRAYDIMMFNLHVEHLGKLRQGGGGTAGAGSMPVAAAEAPQP